MDHRLAEVLNSFFRSIYVITLPRLKDRQAALARSCEGLNYQLFYGSDQTELSLSELIKEGAYDPRSAERRMHKMHMGEVATSLSHCAVYEDALKKKRFPVLILEDDAVPSSSCSAEEVRAGLEALPKDWLMCYLGYFQHEQTNARQWFKYGIELIFRKIFYYTLYKSLRTYFERLRLQMPRPVMKLGRPFSGYLSRSGIHMGAHAYALSEEGCSYLYHLQKPLHMPSDHALVELRRAQGRQVFTLKSPAFINKSVSKAVPSVVNQA